MKFGIFSVRPLFILSALGILAGIGAAVVFGMEEAPLPPRFKPASDPYGKGIFATGIVESALPNGENINIYPEVSGTVTRVLVAEGQAVTAGTPLLAIDDSVQSATVAQLRSQAEAAKAMLEELKAQPRKETLHVSEAQLSSSEASLKMAEDQWRKQKASFDINPKSVSRDALDNARNAFEVAKANLGVAKRQYELTRAGAWIYDIRNQESQYQALEKAYLASSALLAKYVLKAPSDGAVLRINAPEGGYVSPQGSYAAYTAGFDPVLVLGTNSAELNVRCYVDEILVHRLPPADKVKAQMSIRGTDIKLPLAFVRVQPYVTPKIELSSQRTERVDVRVLPVIFHIDKPQDVRLYPGQLVDIYIGS